MDRIDLYATNEQNGVRYGSGHVLPFGASLVPGGVNFSVFSKDATSCSLCLFHHGAKTPYVEIPMNEFRIGFVYAVFVFDLDIEDIEYGYRLDGPYIPERGLLFDASRIMLDPYAKSVSGRTVWGQKPDFTDPFPYRGQVIRTDFDWMGDKLPEIPMTDLVIYEAHVRGMTCGEGGVQKHPGTFSALREKIPYLKSLGINCIELLPIFEFDEFEYAEPSHHDHRRDLKNYWGYSTVCFFAPKAGYAASARYRMEADELKTMIRAFHRNGIEVFLDVVFNHTAEGDETGRYISYKGIDNSVYYLLGPRGKYLNFSGCGNTFNCNNALVRNTILDCLRYWASDYHIDGFRFDLASILSRDKDGNAMQNPPLLEELAHDAVLGRCKLIAEAWDAGGLYQVGSFPDWGRWAEWNGKYRDCVRRFIKGDASCAPELYKRLAGSPDLYEKRSAAASVNFVTCHDGYTLYDLVSYQEKHNYANMENNRDGGNENNSWNCGAEGETDSRDIMNLRYRQMKNIDTLLLMSRGVPMLLAGDEFANSQGGNNNAYCQDNELSWLNWKQLEEERNQDLKDYVAGLINFRKQHPVLRNKFFDKMYNRTGYPELSFHGTKPWNFDTDMPALSFGCMFAEEHNKYRTAQDAYIYLLVNAHWQEQMFELPIVPRGFRWKIAMSTGWTKAVGAESGISESQRDRTFLAESRSCAIFLAEP